MKMNRRPPDAGKYQLDYYSYMLWQSHKNSLLVVPAVPNLSLDRSRSHAPHSPLLQRPNLRPGLLLVDQQLVNQPSVRISLDFQPIDALDKLFDGELSLSTRRKDRRSRRQRERARLAHLAHHARNLVALDSSGHASRCVCVK